MKRALVLALMASFYACDNPVDITGPGPTPPPPVEDPPPGPGPEPPPDWEAVGPRVDDDARPQDIRGYSKFALSIRDTMLIQAIVDNAHGFGYNTPRVCAEHRSWGRHGLPSSPPIESAQAVHNIRRLLEVTARIPGTQVLLMTNCNLKEDGATLKTQVDWAATVARVVTGQGIRGLKATDPFKHVILEAVNEHYHPNSSVRSASRVNQIIAAIRNVAPGYNITTDDNFSGPRDVSYNGNLRADFASAHPWRVDFSAPPPHPRLVPTRADLRACKREPGCAIVFHKDEEGLTASQPFSWMPHWGSL
jgi:hypothetical protein